jgi:hypothetical protein
VHILCNNPFLISFVIFGLREISAIWMPLDYKCPLFLNKWRKQPAELVNVWRPLDYLTRMAETEINKLFCVKTIYCSCSKPFPMSFTTSGFSEIPATWTPIDCKLSFLLNKIGERQQRTKWNLDFASFGWYVSSFRYIHCLFIYTTNSKAEDPPRNATHMIETFPLITKKESS